MGVAGEMEILQICFVAYYISCVLAVPSQVKFDMMEWVTRVLSSFPSL